jgi:LysM repeat protein
MPQTLIITLLLFAFVLPILGAVALRLLMPRLTPVQLYSAAVLLLGVVIASVLVLARGDIPSLQIGNLSILLPVTAPDDSSLSLVPTASVDQSPALPTLNTSAPVTATAALTATVLPQHDTATSVQPSAAATQTATAEPTVAPTAAPTTPPEPTAAPPTAIPPTAAPAPPAAQRKYTVQPGDTLLAIAKKFNTTVTAIVKANKLTPQQADALRVGQELVIP